MAGHSAVVGNTYSAALDNLAVGIPAAESRPAGNKAAIGGSVRHRGRRLGGQEGDRWAVVRSFAVAFFEGCVCAERKMGEDQGRNPC